MKRIEQETYIGERSLFHEKDLELVRCCFGDGESPLKESSHIKLIESSFKWKYPLWYSKNAELENCILFETARSGIWYTDHIEINNTIIEAPKTFRRSSNIKLSYVELPHAEETLWNCKNIELKNVTATGDYFGMNSEKIVIDHLILNGNYCFDGASDIEVRNSKLISKDAFWNCKNVTVYDSIITGEYLGWNSENVTFIRCEIESNQGMCYMKNVKLVDCTCMNTDLSFEYSTVDATIQGKIDSIKNPISGKIVVDKVDEIILDSKYIDPTKSLIEVKK